MPHPQWPNLDSFCRSAWVCHRNRFLVAPSPERLRPDISSVMRSVEMNPLHRRVSRIAGTAQILRPGRDAEHPTAAGNDLLLRPRGSSVKHFRVRQRVTSIETGNYLSLRVAAGITA